ncbi:MAG: hypothetical protein ABUK01_08345 [Leptospirales bacterium]
MKNLYLKNIKKLSVFLLFFAILGVHNAGIYSSDDNEWTEYEASPMITIEEAKSITTWENTPGSLLTYFYASKIRGDQDWKKVLPPENQWSERLIRKLQKMEKWKFVKFQLIAIENNKTDKRYVKIFIQIEINGRVDGGKDEATVEKIDGKWVIVSVPT